MMAAIKTENGDQYVCAHWKSFPPVGSRDDSASVEQKRARKEITEAEYQQLGVWKKMCGLQKMDVSKCLACKHRRKVEIRPRGPVMIDPKGVVIPIVDSALAEAAAGHRSFMSGARKNIGRG